MSLDNVDVYASFSKNEVIQTRALSTIQGSIYQQSKDLKKTIDDSYILSKANGSEILIWMISDLDRAYKPECMHASPIAYGIKGYQLTASIFRNVLHHILKNLYDNNIYVPVVSFDGQWYNLIVRDKSGNPLTQLQLQKDVYKKATKMSKKGIQNILFSIGKYPTGMSNTEHHIKIQKQKHVIYVEGLNNGMIFFSNMSTVQRIFSQQVSKK